jgi:N6-adenosine-specific RNA methylase IME4
MSTRPISSIVVGRRHRRDLGDINELAVSIEGIGRHSEKPRAFYDFVEKLCPAPRYCVLFSRYRHNEKWDVHGDQAPAMREAAS